MINRQEVSRDSDEAFLYARSTIERSDTVLVLGARQARDGFAVVSQ